ncbi:MAG: vWA domain-containing protein [Acetobacteraceae bacterium]
MIHRRPLLALLAVAPAALRAHAASTPAPRRPLPVPGRPALYQRVILRPGASLHSTPDPANGTELPGFTVYYVYARTTSPTGGWIEIGRAADGETSGWTPADKTIAWRHTMVGAFTNPAGRGRALFFRDKATLDALLEGSDCGAKAATFRAAALSGKPGPVIAVEPALYVDITKNFYLLPIISAEPIDTYDGASVRLLETISAPANGSEKGAPTEAEALAKFRAGLVFLLDTTESMQPYIDATRTALREVIARIGVSPVAANFRFGAIGFRDSLKDSPALQYTTRVFAKPDFSKPADAVLTAMARMRASTVSSREFDEDPIAGIRAAIDDINWAPLGGRYVVLITDAGARVASDPLSATGLGIAEIRSYAKAHGVDVLVLHLLTPEGAQAHDHARAAAQYGVLTRQDAGGSLYFPVPGGTPEALHRSVRDLVGALLKQVAHTVGYPLPAVGSPPPKQMARSLAIAADAMRLAYLGRVEGTRAPDVVHGFTSDHSYSHPSRRSIDVRVLLTRDQLSDLAAALQAILRAGEATRINPQRFFTELRAAVVTAASDPQRIPHYAKLGDVIGQFLDGLPYRSDLMNISQSDWMAMGGIAQDEKLQEVAAKLRLYQAFAATPALWVDLAGPDKPGEAAFPVPLEALP